MDLTLEPDNEKDYNIIIYNTICSFGQIYKHNRVFSDTLNYKDFNQGFIDSQVYFIVQMIIY